MAQINYNQSLNTKHKLNMSQDKNGATEPVIIMQIECHSEPMVMDVTKEGLLARAKAHTWKECPMCSAENEWRRIKKLQKLADKGHWMEMIDGEVAIVTQVKNVPYRMIEGKEMNKHKFNNRYSKRQYGEFKGSYHWERMMTLEQRNLLWSRAPVVRVAKHRSVKKADRNLIGPFYQNNANLKLSNDKVVCKLHSETVFAVQELKEAPTIATDQRQPHNVCGHYRILASGERTWVRSHNRGF
jgi:hypothetical protein